MKNFATHLTHLHYLMYLPNYKAFNVCKMACKMSKKVQDAALFAVFQIVGHRIETQFVPTFQEVLKLDGRFLLAGDGRFASEAFQLHV